MSRKVVLAHERPKRRRRSLPPFVARIGRDHLIRTTRSFPVASIGGCCTVPKNRLEAIGVPVGAQHSDRVPLNPITRQRWY
jgi:hypothetical protein